MSEGITRMKYSIRLATLALCLAAGLTQGAAIGSAQTKAADIALLKGPDRERTLLAGAEKEGKVVLYSAMIVNQALRPLVDAFKKKYPKVDLEFWRADTSDILQKVLTERRANAQLVDVVEWGGGTSLAIKAGVVQPFLSAYKDAYPAGHYDAEGRYAATRLSYYGLAYNTKLVSDAAVPKTYDDLLDPKWRGKIAWAISESGHVLFLVHILMTMGDKADGYLARLGRQDIVPYTGSARALVDRVGQGEYPLALHIFAHHPLISKAMGAPLDVQMLPPIPSDFSAVQVIKDAPHPHAAMLLVDYLLSEDGQNILKAADYLPSLPKVDPPDSLRKIVPRLNGAPENVIPALTFLDKREAALEMYKKHFDK